MRTTPIFMAACMFAIACDSAEPTTTAQPSDGAAELEDADEDDDVEASAELERDHRGRHGNPADRLCDQVGCTDEQRAEIDALFERPEKREHDPAANQALAKAFRSDAFSAADVEAFMKTMRPDDRLDEHVDKLAALHGILTAEQRATLATDIEENGFFGHGRGREHGKWDKDKKIDGGAKFVDRKVEKLCEPLACSADQRKKLSAIVGQAKADRMPKDDDASQKAIADAMRAETFDTAAVKAELEAGKAEHEARHAERMDVIVAIHGVLTAEQRDKVADRIETEGAGALLGHRGGKHHRKGKR